MIGCVTNPGFTSRACATFYENHNCRLKQYFYRTSEQRKSQSEVRVGPLQRTALHHYIALSYRLEKIMGLPSGHSPCHLLKLSFRFDWKYFYLHRWHDSLQRGQVQATFGFTTFDPNSIHRIFQVKREILCLFCCYLPPGITGSPDLTKNQTIFLKFISWNEIFYKKTMTTGYITRCRTDYEALTLSIST